MILPWTEPQPKSPTAGMIVAQVGDVLIGMAINVNRIAAVRVRLSSGQGQVQTGVPVNRAFRVGSIAAVRVRLSSGQGQVQTGVPVNRAFRVGSIAAVRVRLSLGQGHSSHPQVEPGDGVEVFRMEMAGTSNAVSDVGVPISTNIAGPQETNINRIRLDGKKRKILGNILFIKPCLCCI